MKHSPLLALITSPSLVFFLPHWSLLSLLHWNLMCYVTSNAGELQVLVFNPCFYVYSSPKKSHLCLWLWIPSLCCWFSNIYLPPWPLPWAPNIYSQFPIRQLHSTWISNKDIKLLIGAIESLITLCHHYVHHTSSSPGSSFQQRVPSSLTLSNQLVVGHFRLLSFPQPPYHQVLWVLLPKLCQIHPFLSIFNGTFLVEATILSPFNNCSNFLIPLPPLPWHSKPHRSYRTILLIDTLALLE